MNKPFFILAPMDDVTDTVFRRIVSDCAAPDLTMTEFVNVDGLTSVGRPKLLPKLDASQDMVQVYAQIWGKHPENFELIAREISEGKIPGFSGIDINMGCPDKAVVKNECCSALAQSHLREKAVEIIKATQSGAGKMPVSIKARLGFDKIDYSWHELLLRQKPAMLTIHVRTTKQMSKVAAKWDALAPIIKLRDEISPGTKIVLNGDILTRKQGEELAKEFGADGIMIGRGVFTDPYVFANKSPWADYDKEKRIALFRKHLELFEYTYPAGERKFAPLKKFAKIYISDFDGAKELREKLMAASSVEEMLSYL